MWYEKRYKSYVKNHGLGHIESKKADTLSTDLANAWKKLGTDAEQRQEDLQNAVAAQNYLAAANDAQMWIAVRNCVKWNSYIMHKNLTL